MTATAIRKIKADDEQDTGDASNYQVRTLAAWQRASIWHLLDLKKDGWSPRHTELVIDPRTDRVVKRPERRPQPDVSRRRKGRKRV